MTLNQIYEFINLVSLKENNGNLFEIDDMNNAIIGIDSSFIRSVIQPGVMNNIIYESLLPLKSDPTDVSLTVGVGNLPADFYHILSCKASGRKVDQVTELDDDERETSPVRAASTRYPTYILYDGEIRVKPTSISTVSIVYYLKPTTPFLDYYINSNDKTVALAESATRYIGSGETGSQGQISTAIDVDLADPGGEAFLFLGDVRYRFANVSQFTISGSVTNDGTYTVSSVSYGPTTSGYTIVYVNENVATSDSTGNASNFLLSSQTVELDFGEDLHLRYAWMILSILGIRVSFQELVQYSEGMQQKDKQE